MGDSLVYFIVETQLLLRPYLEGRMKMHFLYKIWRADGPQALYTDFKIEANHDVRSFEAVQNDAAKDMKQFLADTDDVNQQLPEKNGATRLWLAAEQGHLEAVREILRHPKVDPNKVRLSSKTSPLFIASHLGHDDVVQAIVSHADVQVNLGAVDSGATPLFMAVQGGREGVVDILLDQKHIDVNHGTQDGISPLCKAAQLGHEHITQSLLGAQGIDVTRAAKDGTTAMSTAAKAQHVKIILMLKAHLEMANFRPSADLPFPARHQFVSDAQFCRAVLGFCKDASSTNSIVETQLLPLHDTIM
jgi:ankyrin repeat protein